MICEICKTNIKEPFYVEINPILIRFDESFVGKKSYSLTEKQEFSSSLIMHQSCWKKLIVVKHDITKKVEVI